MHELGQLIQELMDSERMTQADLARRSGLSRQLVNTLIKGEMKALPTRTTFDGLRQAFPAVPYSTFVLRAAASMGIPVEDQPTADYNGLSNDALLGILKDRLEGDSDGRQPEAQKTTHEAVTPNVTHDNLELSARHTPRDQPSPGKRIHDALDAVGEESQDPGE